MTNHLQDARAAMDAARNRGEPQSKAAAIKALMQAGDMEAAILMAAKLPQLGEHRDAILKAREGINNPAFQRQLGRDPAALIAGGTRALADRFAR